MKFAYQLISKFDLTIMGHTHYKKNFLWMPHEFRWDRGPAPRSPFWSVILPGGCSNLVFTLQEWIPISNAVFAPRALLHAGRSALCMQAESSSDLRMVETEIGRNCRKYFSSLSFVLFRYFSYSPSHAYMYICALSLLCIATSRLLFKDLQAFSECFWTSALFTGVLLV